MFSKKLQVTKKTVMFILLTVFFVVLDSFFKTLSVKGKLAESICLISDIFCLKFTPNANIAFSLPFSGPILIAGIILILVILFYYLIYLIKNKRENEYLLLTFLIFGAIINLLDRIKYGYVIDYFDLKWFTVFNLADIMISTSIFILIILNLCLKHTKRDKEE